MSQIQLYHNPNCSKSRGALELLKERGVDFETIEYLANPPDRSELESILDRLPDSPGELVREDKQFKALGLSPDAISSREAVIGVLLEHPELMQRPLAMLDDRGVIARPPERVLELID